MLNLINPNPARPFSGLNLDPYPIRGVVDEYFGFTPVDPTNQVQLPRGDIPNSKANVTRTKKQPNPDMAILGEAVAWPLYSLDRECMAPAVFFAAMLFVSPWIWPTLTPGAAVITSYTVGTGAYLVENLGETPVFQLKGNQPGQ